MQDEIFLKPALKYASWGWPVLPLKVRSKEPLGGSHGVSDATTNVKTIIAWGHKYPDANIGLATGVKFDVIDCDPRNGGNESVKILAAQGFDFPDGPLAWTHSDGWHLYMKVTAGNKPKSLAPGLDIQSLGRYVVAPPSIGPSGKLYAWDTKRRPHPELLRATPDWLKAKYIQSVHPKSVVKSFRTDVHAGERNNTLTQIIGVYSIRVSRLI